MDFGPIAVHVSRSQCCVFHRDKHQSFDQTRLVEAVEVTAPVQLALEGSRRQEATQAQIEDRDGVSRNNDRVIYIAADVDTRERCKQRPACVPF